ncbi:MAG: hypothetical protein ACOX4M_09820 [Acetivibrionales bacterium]
MLRKRSPGGSGCSGNQLKQPRKEAELKRRKATAAASEEVATSGNCSGNSTNGSGRK